MFPTINIFGLTIQTYGIMMFLAIMAAYFVASYNLKYNKELNTDALFWLAVSACVGGFIGAKVLFIFVEFDQFLLDPLKFLAVGYVFYGGLIGGILGCMFYAKLKHKDTLRIFDLAAPSVAFAHVLGRLGCFLAGCCYGGHTDGFLAVTFPGYLYLPELESVHPVQLYEAFANIILGTVLLRVLAKHHEKRGLCTGIYLTSYAVIRFSLEFLRNDDRGFVGALSTSQFISIFILILGVLFLMGVPQKFLKPAEAKDEPSQA
jgi:phosphatidylglycerol:prolipoprotein diacylglycerol transferase